MTHSFWRERVQNVAFPVLSVAFTASRFANACIMIAPVSTFCAPAGAGLGEWALGGMAVLRLWRGGAALRARLCDGDHQAFVIPLQRVQVRIDGALRR